MTFNAARQSKQLHSRITDDFPMSPKVEEMDPIQNTNEDDILPHAFLGNHATAVL